MGNNRDKSKVVVVYGNKQVKREMFAFLRALHLFPIEWEQAVNSGSPHISAILNEAFETAWTAIVLLTEDEDVKRRPQALDGERHYDNKWASQPRPNVLFEAGMAFALFRDNTILVEIGNVRPFSDISGHYAIKWSGRPEDRHNLANRLAKVGCTVDTSGEDWLTAGNFTIL